MISLFLKSDRTEIIIPAYCDEIFQILLFPIEEVKGLYVLVIDVGLNNFSYGAHLIDMRSSTPTSTYLHYHHQMLRNPDYYIEGPVVFNFDQPSLTLSAYECLVDEKKILIDSYDIDFLMEKEEWFQTLVKTRITRIGYPKVLAQIICGYLYVYAYG